MDYSPWGYKELGTTEWLTGKKLGLQGDFIKAYSESKLYSGYRRQWRVSLRGHQVLHILLSSPGNCTQPTDIVLSGLSPLTAVMKSYFSINKSYEASK